MNALMSDIWMLTTTSLGFEPPLALRSVSTPREAPDPVTSADFDSDPVGFIRLPRPNPFFLGCSSFFSSSFVLSDLPPPPASPAAPASTPAISACGLAV